MAAKVFRSTLSWRTLEYQDSILADFISAGAPVYTDEDDLQSLLRPTQRKTKDTLVVASLAVLAREEQKLKNLVAALGKKNFGLKSLEEDVEIECRAAGKKILELWRYARTKGSAKVGGRISADRRKKDSAAGAAKIADRWPLPTRDWSTEALLKEAGISLNTAKRILGNRPIAQHNYRTKNAKQLKQQLMSPTPREKVVFCGLYVFQIEDGVFKIGISGDTKKRFKHVSQYHKKNMKIVEMYDMDIKRAAAVEYEVHYRLRKYRCREYNGREIFKVSLNTIKRAVNQAIKAISEGIKYE